MWRRCAFALITAVVVCLLPEGSTGQPTAAGQQLAVQRMYEAMDGPSWSSDFTMGWENRANTYCGLAGIACRSDPALSYPVIYSIYMSGCNLGGSLPAELVNLLYLVTLDVSNNPRLSGSLPVGFGSAWPMLIHLNIGSTSMHGTLQVEIGYLKQLVRLFLNDLYLVGTIPDGWGTNLTALNMFQLCSSTFHDGSPTRDRLRGSIPVTFQNAHQMLNFKICYQFMDGTIPDVIVAGWPRLQEMQLIGNRFSGTIPPSLAACVNLGSVELQQNAFVGAIPPFGSIPQPNMTMLNVGFNSGISGTFPALLGNNNNMEVIILDDIGLLRGEIPEGFQQLKRLQTLRMNKAALTGTLPEFFGLLPGMQELTLSNCSLTGILYPSWANMNFTDIDLSHNRLTGMIPDEWFPADRTKPMRLSSLRKLFLNDNMLEGTIPEALSRARGLQKLSLNSNRFSGSLADSFSVWPMTEFNVDSNMLNGTLSPLFGNWSGITAFSVWNNSLTGTLPPEYSSFKLVKTFYVSNNLLNGSLPPSYKAFNILTISRFEENRLTGVLPADWSEMSLVQQLSLHKNSLTGVLPLQWAKFGPTLTTLSLDYNQLTGSIPGSWSAFSSAFVSLSNNKLTGTLPVEFGRPTSPLYVIASSNCLTTSGMSSWWSSFALVLPQLPAELCGGATPVPQESTSRPGNASGPSSSPTTPELRRSATAAVAASPLIALSGAMATGAFQRTLFQFSLLSCTTDLTDAMDAASSPLQLQFGDSAGASFRGTIIGNAILLMSIAAFGVALALLRTNWQSSRTGVTARRQKPMKERVLMSLQYFKFPGIMVIPFLFLAQPLMSVSMILLRYSPGGPGDVVIGLIGILLLCSGGAHIAFGVRQIESGAKFTLLGRREATVKKKRTNLFARMIDFAFGEVGEWSNASRGSMFVDAWGSLFDGYRGRCVWSWLPARFPRSFVVVEAAATLFYGIIEGLIPASGEVGPERSCMGLRIATLVVALFHTSTTLLVWPFISRWEATMGLSPTILGLLWIILAVSGSNEDSLKVFSEAQVWLFVASLGANLITVMLNGSWLASVRRIMSGVGDDRGSDQPTALELPPTAPSRLVLKKEPSSFDAAAVSEGQLLPLVNVDDRSAMNHEEVTSLHTLADIVQLICSHRSKRARRHRSV